MKLNPGSTPESPNVSRTATKALVVVMIEVCLFTALLGLAMAALPGMSIVNGEVNAPGAEGVRDYMLRYMAQVFGGGSLVPFSGILPHGLSASSSESCCSRQSTQPSSP